MTREPWEAGFDEWTPPRAEPADPDDAGVDLERESLLRLARELAETRRAEQRGADAELEQLKRELRARAEAVAARERELSELERRLDRGKAPKAKPRRQDDIALETVVARERAALERSHALDARERDLRARQAALAAEAERLGGRERELEAALETAQAQRGESEADRRLADAERERLARQAGEARRIEKELADARSVLEARVQSLADAGRAALDPEDARTKELLALEARLELRERELALQRQGLDAERNALLERDRALRRRELAEARQVFEPPLAPPSFSEGLAAFVRERARR